MSSTRCQQHRQRRVRKNGGPRSLEQSNRNRGNGKAQANKRDVLFLLGRAVGIVVEEQLAIDIERNLWIDICAVGRQRRRKYKLVCIGVCSQRISLGPVWADGVKHGGE